MSRYSFLTAYLADPAPQNTRDHGGSAPATTGGAAACAPQQTAPAATQNTRYSSPTPAAQPGGGGRRVQAPSVVKPGGANSAGRSVAPPDMRKPARRTATYTPRRAQQPNIGGTLRGRNHRNIHTRNHQPYTRPRTALVGVRPEHHRSGAGGTGLNT